jgi:hypothetical protein
MLRTNVYINKTVVENALKFSSVKTKKAIINIALEEYVENHKPKKPKEVSLKSVMGLGGFYEDYDYKAMRINPHLPE